MSKDLLIPKATSNDESVTIVEWLVTDKAYITAGQSILVIETSKTNVEIESEASGFILMQAKVEDSISVSACFAKVFDSIEELEQHQKTNQKNNAPLTSATLPNFSNAALKYIQEHQINPADFANIGLVTVEKIKATFHATKEPVTAINKEQFPRALREPLSTTKLSAIANMAKGQEGTIISSLTVQLNSQEMRAYLKNCTWLNRRILPYILYVFSRMLAENPYFTSYYSEKHINLYNKVNLGLAVDLGKGLKVVVIEDPELQSLFDLQMSIIDCIAAYHEDSLHLSSLKNSTVTVTDLSQDNILNFQPVLNAHQAMILGIGGDQDLPGSPLTLTVVFDHRVLSGQEVASFLKNFKERLLTEYLSLDLNAITM